MILIQYESPSLDRYTVRDCTRDTDFKHFDTERTPSIPKGPFKRPHHVRWNVASAAGPFGRGLKFTSRLILLPPVLLEYSLEDPGHCNGRYGGVSQLNQHSLIDGRLMTPVMRSRMLTMHHS